MKIFTNKTSGIYYWDFQNWENGPNLPRDGKDTISVAIC
jgi:hypothetical protein